MKTLTELLIILFLITTSCTNKKIEAKKGQIGKPEIIHLQDTYSDKYFLFENFQDNENTIKYLFDFSKKTKGTLWILTNENGAIFEDGYAILDTTYQRIVFYREYDNVHDTSIKVNFKRTNKIDFIEKTEKDRISLSRSFELLDLNILQNMLDYAEGDENRKKNKSFTYQLYNKDDIKKVVIVYHNYGEWFSIDIL